MRRFQNELGELGRKAEQEYTPKTAIFADSYRDLKDAVFTWKHKWTGSPAHSQNLIAIVCDTEKRASDLLKIKNFDPVGVYEFSEHPGIQLFYPPVIDMLNFCYEQKFTRIHVLIPGPLGLSGLLIARILKLPIVCTYLDTLPGLVRCFTKDDSVDHIIRRYSNWFYNQMGRIYTTSSRMERKLTQEGIQSEKIKIIETRKDARNFHSLKHDRLFNGRFQFPRIWKVYDSGSSVKAAT
jgi:hypothetical protein